MWKAQILMLFHLPALLSLQQRGGRPAKTHTLWVGMWTVISSTGANSKDGPCCLKVVNTFPSAWLEVQLSFFFSLFRALIITIIQGLHVINMEINS